MVDTRDKVEPLANPSTLHEAMLLILTESDEPWLSVKDLTKRISARGLYRMRDGRDLKPGQVHARANDYSHLFEKEGSRVRARFELESAVHEGTTGSYLVVEVRVIRRRDQTAMPLEIRVTYSELAGKDDPDSYALALARDQARRTLLDSSFEPGQIRTLLLTTLGWQPVES